MTVLGDLLRHDLSFLKFVKFVVILDIEVLMMRFLGWSSEKVKHMLRNFECLMRI